MLTSNGSSAPTWTSPTANITITDDTTTNASFYPVMVAAAGSAQNATITTTKLYFNPSTGDLSVTNLNTLSDMTLKTDFQAIDNPLLYYPINIANDIRPDQLAYKQYQDPYTSWIIYLSNDIIDPYFEWYLNDSQLINFVKDKYGSMDSAMNKVAYYINNYIDQPNITTAGLVGTNLASGVMN